MVIDQNIISIKELENVYKLRNKRIGKILFNKLVFYDIKLCSDKSSGLLKKLELLYNEKYFQYIEQEKRTTKPYYSEPNCFEKEPNEFEDMSLTV